MSPADLPFRSPAPAAAHLPAAVLRQYAAGTLTPAERRRVEHHALDCALCADALEGYQQAPPAATSPAALAELQQRLHQRVAAEPVRTGGAWWLSAAAAVVLLLAVIGIWQWPRQEAAPVAQAPRPAPKAEPAPTPEPAVAAASAPAAMARAADSTVPPATSAPPTPPESPAYAANTPARVRRAAASTYRAPVAAVQPVQEAESALSDAASEAVPVAPPVDIAATPPPAPAKSELSDVAESKPMAKAKVAAGRAAAAFAADTSAPLAGAPAASQPPLREESSKRKAELPPAPALAPFPTGGYPAYRNYLLREQNRPEGVPRNDGTVKLKFTVEADGSVQNIQVVRGINEELDAEAIRLGCEGPSWRPGIVGGRRTSQAVRLDVPFR